MKQLLIVFLGLTLLSAATPAVAVDRQIQEKRIISAVNSLKSEEEADVINLGPVAISLIKVVGGIVATSDPEVKAGMKLIKGLKRLVVADYEGVEECVRNRFNKRMFGLFEDCSLLMSISEDGSHTSIYATVSDDGFSIGNLVIFCPDEGTLVCLFGNFNVQEAMKVIEDNL